MTTFNRQIQEDFSGIPSLAYSSDTSGGSTVTNILSRYSNLTEGDSSIKNFDQINMGLTSHYASQNSSGQKIAWSLDDISNNSNASRGAFDRYIWSGAIETDSSGNSVFKSANIDSKDTDGLMMIPSPYFPFVEGSKVMANNYNPQDSIRVKLKFDNLPANTFVPLFGFAYSTISSPMETTNSQGSLYRSNRSEMTGSYTQGGNGVATYATSDYDRHYNVPGAIASDSNNLYQKYSNESYWQNDYVKNTVLWFMYAHDGNGNGMVATCAGEVDSNDPATHQMRPTNEYFGSDNGYLKFKAPKVLDDFLSSNSLSDLWDYYGTGGAGQSSLATDDPRREMRQVYHYHREDPLDIQSSLGTGRWLINQASNHNVSTGGVVYASPYTLCGTSHVSSTYQSYGNYPGDLNYSHLQLISYGPTNNSTFSNAEDILINANLISQLRKSVGHYGLSDTDGMQPGDIWNGCQYLYTGKILDFTFKDAPGQMFFDATPAYGVLRTCNWGTGRTSHVNAYSGLGPSALILRPSVTGGGEIHSFSYANYDSSGSELIGGNGLNSDYYKSASGTEYVFPNEGHSYNPISSPSFDDPSSKWNNTSNLTDSDVSTTAELTETGESNALYVSLNGTSASLSSSESDYDLASLSVNVRGVTLSGFTSHILYFAITDSSKEKIPFLNDFIEVSQNSNLISPAGDGAFSLKFKSTSSYPVSYASIKNGFLKIWAEPGDSNQSIPSSFRFDLNSSFLVSSSGLDSDRTFKLGDWTASPPNGAGSNLVEAANNGVKLPTKGVSEGGTEFYANISKVFDTTIGTTYTIEWEDVVISPSPVTYSTGNTNELCTRIYVDTEGGISGSPQAGATISYSGNIAQSHDTDPSRTSPGFRSVSFTAVKSSTEVLFMAAQGHGHVVINNIEIKDVASSLPSSFSFDSNTIFSRSSENWSNEYDYNGTNSATAEANGVKLPTGSTTGTGLISKIFNTNIGQTYTLQWEDIAINGSGTWTRAYANTTNNTYIYSGSHTLDSSNIISTEFPFGGNLPSAGIRSFSFTATESTTEIALMGAGPGGNSIINNIQIS